MKISRIASNEIERLWKQGKFPTVQEIVELNELGKKVEKSNSSLSTDDFSSLPRTAFLGDWILTEPTVAKRIWMDNAFQLLSDDNLQKLFFVSWALTLNDHELPSLNNIKETREQFQKFYDEVLICYTMTQIENAVDWVLNGEGYISTDECDNGDIPDELRSMTQQLYDQVLSYGLDSDVKYEITVPQLERMLVSAVLHKGIDVLKDERNQNIGNFYKYLGNMKKRLIENG